MDGKELITPARNKKMGKEEKTVCIEVKVKGAIIGKWVTIGTDDEIEHFVKKLNFYIKNEEIW